MACDPYQELPWARRRRLIFRAVLRGLLNYSLLPAPGPTRPT
jgi:hypothetical protein